MRKYSRKKHTVQTKLDVSTPSDKFEKEADAIADGITRPESTAALQRKSAPQTDSDTKAAGSGGQAMDKETHCFMSNRFGTDFSKVKIHTDQQSTNLNRQLNAKAFTVGNDIYFKAGEYQPSANAGKKLLAHELTHVLQQNKGNTPAIQRQVMPDVDLRENASPLMASSLGSVEINKFPTGSAEIPIAGLAALKNAASQILFFLKKYPMSTVKVTGHTDTVGTDGNNELLGEERAIAVRDFLLQEGVPAEIITTESKGETEPAVPTKNNVSQPANRRVTVFFQVSAIKTSFGTGGLKPPSKLGTPADPPPKIDLTPKPVPEGIPPYADRGIWWEMEERIREAEKGLPKKDKSLQDFAIDKLMDKVFDPIIKKLPVSVRKKARELTRKALEAGTEKACDAIPDEALKAACKATIKQKLK